MITYALVFDWFLYTEIVWKEFPLKSISVFLFRKKNYWLYTIIKQKLFSGTLNFTSDSVSLIRLLNFNNLRYLCIETEVNDLTGNLISFEKSLKFSYF